MITIHAAYQIGDERHITIFYNDKCDTDTLFLLVEHLKLLPIGRVVKIVDFVELDNHKDMKNPLIGAKLAILNEKGDEPDLDLMKRIADFSDTYSWRSNLKEDEQYKFTLHTTLGLKSEINLSELTDLQFITGSKYMKNHHLNIKIKL